MISLDFREEKSFILFSNHCPIFYKGFGAVTPIKMLQILIRQYLPRFRCIRILSLLVCMLGFAHSLSAAENNKIGKISFASSEWQPFSYEDRGERKGLYIDILKQVFEVELGGELHCQFSPWKRAQLKVKTGIADFLVTVPTDKRLEYAIKSEHPILQLYLYVYTYKDHPRLDAIQTISSGMDIKRLNLTPVTNFGNGWHKNNIDKYGVKTIYVPNEENAFRFLALKRADITIEPLYAASFQIKNYGLTDKILPTRARFGPIVFHLLLSKKSPYAGKIKEIDRAIGKVIASPGYREILEQYEKIN